MSINRYAWVAVQRDGTILQRWNSDNTENVPDPHNTAELHLLPAPEWPHLRPFSLFLTRSQKLIYKKRRHMDSGQSGGGEDHDSTVFVVGYEQEIDHAHFSAYAFLLPDGRIEWCSSFNHNTVFERNLEEHPPLFYETWPN